MSGERGCDPKSREFNVYNMIHAELTECIAKWEPSNICPDQKVGEDGKKAALKHAHVSYFEACTCQLH